jgi:long-chain acyl-CoA synthetase
MVKFEQEPTVAQPWMKFWPKETPRHLEYEEIPLDEILRRNAKELPQRDAIYFEGFRMTHAELDHAVDVFTTGLNQLGIKPRDVVLIDTPNCPQFVIAFFAIIRLGAIANPIIPLNRFTEIVHQANDSNAKALIILDVLFEEHLHGKDLEQLKTVQWIVLTGVKEYLPSIKRVVGGLLGKVPHMANWPTGQIKNIKFQTFQDIFHSGSPIQLPIRKVNPREDVAVLIYTGGTTGSPKGVMTTHFNLLANCIQAINWVGTQIPKLLQLKGHGGMLIILPLSHSFALSVGMNMGLYFGYKLVLLPSPPKHAYQILQVIQKEKVTFCPGVPTLWNKIGLDPKSLKFKNRLAGFEACLSGAAPLAPEVQQKFEGITGAKIIEGYGMSEASPILTVNSFTASRPGTVGAPLPDTFIKIVDPDTGDKILSPAPPGDLDGSQYTGEICGCGPQIMIGYLNRPEENRKVLRTDEKGFKWYYTSDLGYINSDGFLVIKDRKRDLIKRKGHSVFPREIEDLMYQYEPILEVGVYGVKVKDPEIGEEIKAGVSLKPEFKGKVTEQDILKWCKENIAGYKYPREIQIYDELPKSLIGKVLRRVLRDEDTTKSQGKQEPAP